MTDYKTLSIRMPVEMARSVEMIADALHQSQVDVIREAVAYYIEGRKHDPGFQKRLRAHIEADLALLRTLEVPGGS